MVFGEVIIPSLFGDAHNLTIGCQASEKCLWLFEDLHHFQSYGVTSLKDWLVGYSGIGVRRARASVWHESVHKSFTACLNLRQAKTPAPQLHLIHCIFVEQAFGQQFLA
jgi:hypothetical protein